MKNACTKTYNYVKSQEYINKASDFAFTVNVLCVSIGFGKVLNDKYSCWCFFNHRVYLTDMLFLAKKRETFLMEMKRLREGNGCMLPYPGLLGNLIAADMRLPLKPEFMAKLGTSHGNLSLLVFTVITFVFHFLIPLWWKLCFTLSYNSTT